MTGTNEARRAPYFGHPPGRHPWSRPVLDPDGVRHASISHAAHVTGIGRAKLRALLGDPSSGWRFASPSEKGETP